MAKGNFKSFGLLDDLISGAQEGGSSDLNIIEFSEQVLEITTLYTPQRAVLKAFYNLPLDPDEEAWLEQMVADDKSTWVKGRKYKELALEVGMRAGKTLLASIVVCYEFWKLSKMADPAKAFGLIKNSPIFIITVATTGAQSKDTVFGYTKARMEGSTYFKGLMDNGRLVLKDDRIEFPSKRLTIIGGHSNQAGMVGKTAKLFCMDEAARFKEQSDVDAKSMYSNVGRSTVTFKDEGFKMVVSSAWEEGDIMEWLYERGDPLKEDQTLLAFRLTTWDMNPQLTRNQLRDQYEADEVAARRDHEGIRPGTVENFFTKKAILACIEDKRKSAITFNQITRKVEDRTYVEVMLNEITRVDFPVYSYAHSDPGLKRDSFAFASGRPVKTPDGIKVYIDVVIEWTPQDRGKGVVYPVSYENVEKIIMEVHKARNLRRLTFDHWQNASLVQKLYTKGILTKEVQFSRGHQLDIYQVARRKFNTGMVVLPDDCPKLIRELIHIQLKNGSKIDHPVKNPDESMGSKDLADAVVSVIAQCVDEERSMITGGRSYAPIQTLGKTHVADLTTTRQNLPNISQQIK